MSALRKVLVVDDDPVVGKSFNRVLSGKGYIVVTAEDGYDALNKLQSEKYDAVFTDLRMPGMNGLEVAERIKARQPWVPVVIVTGYGSRTSEERARAAGVAEFLHKPLSPEMIEDSAAKAMHWKEAAEAPVAEPRQWRPSRRPPKRRRRPSPTCSRTWRCSCRRLSSACCTPCCLPFVGLGMLAWLGGKALLEQPRTGEVLRIGRKVLGLVAAPFVGLAYLVVFPFVGLAMLAWFAGKALIVASPEPSEAAAGCTETFLSEDLMTLSRTTGIKVNLPGRNALLGLACGAGIFPVRHRRPCRHIRRTAPCPRKTRPAWNAMPSRASKRRWPMAKSCRCSSPAKGFADSVHNRAAAKAATPRSTSASHGKEGPRSKSVASKRAYSLERMETCRDCHKKTMKQYEDSVHSALVRSGSEKAPLCSDCHNPHATRSAKEKPAGHARTGGLPASATKASPRPMRKACTAGSGEEALACKDCHQTHNVKAAALGDHIKGQCVSCHRDVATTHAEWLPNTERHLEAISCPACHSPGTTRRVNLRLYEGGARTRRRRKGGRAAVREDRRTGPIRKGSGLDARALWSLLQEFNKNGSDTAGWSCAAGSKCRPACRRTSSARRRWRSRTATPATAKAPHRSSPSP